MNAWRAATGAIRTFALREYIPLAPILGAQLLFLFLALNLGTGWGMATAGSIARSIAGASATGYPEFLGLLPMTFSYVEAFTFVVGGAWALPALVGAVLGAERADLAAPAERGRRIRGAVAPTFAALAGGFILTYAWQQLLVFTLQPLLREYLPGGVPRGPALWAISVVVGYAIAALPVYVPVVAVAENAPGWTSLPRGLAVGFARFPVTLLLILLLSLPALVVQLGVQLGGVSIVRSMRPENVAYLLALYALLNSAAAYLVWKTAAWIHTDGEATP